VTQRLSVVGCLSATFLVAVLLVPAVCSAQSEVRLSILGVSEDADLALVRVEDADQGTLIQIREVQTGKVKKSWFVENRNDERKRVKRLLRKKFKEANVDQSDEKGRHTVMGAPDQLKKDYDVLVMRDGRIGVLGSIPITSEEGKPKNKAKAMLKEVVWTPDGKGVLTVVNQKLKLPNGTQNVDELHFFRFRVWKVKWIKPEPSEDSGEETTP
jgi:hypothetical protein